jgi:outer membrane protein OmpA-like peptidoglycan-associated protein
VLGLKQAPRRPARDEAEKPFWISFSDLMSALMVLFLVAMTVALLAITHEITEGEKEKATREEEIRQLLERIRAATIDYPGVSVRARSVDFGDRARFDTNSHRLSPDQAVVLRAFVPKILEAARDPLGEKWLKRVIVEGFADPRGSYLHNLNLSLQRSERVLCVLMTPSTAEAGAAGSADALTPADRLLVRELFLVGGSSFNAVKDSLEESRRIELKLEFLDIGEKRTAPRDKPLEVSKCPLD